MHGLILVPYLHIAFNTKISLIATSFIEYLSIENSYDINCLYYYIQLITIQDKNNLFALFLCTDCLIKITFVYIGIIIRLIFYLDII